MRRSDSTSPNHILAALILTFLFAACGRDASSRLGEGQASSDEEAENAELHALNSRPKVEEFFCPEGPRFSATARGCNDRQEGVLIYLPKKQATRTFDQAVAFCQSYGLDLITSAPLTRTSSSQFSEIVNSKGFEDIEVWSGNISHDKRFKAIMTKPTLAGPRGPIVKPGGSFIRVAGAHTDVNTKLYTACTGEGAKAEVIGTALNPLHQNSTQDQFITGTLKYIDGSYTVVPSVQIEWHPQFRPPNIAIEAYSQSPDGTETFVAVVSGDGRGVDLLKTDMLVRTGQNIIAKDVEGRNVNATSLSGRKVRIKGTVYINPNNRRYVVVEAKGIEQVPTPPLGGCAFEGPFSRTTELGCELTHPVSKRKLTLGTFNRTTASIALPDVRSPAEHLNVGGSDPTNSLIIAFNDVVGSTSFSVPAGAIVQGTDTFDIQPSGRHTFVPDRRLPHFARTKFERSCNFLGEHYPFLSARDIIDFGTHLDFANIVRRDNRLLTNVGGLATIIDRKTSFIPNGLGANSGGRQPQIMCESRAEKGRLAVKGSFDEFNPDFKIVGSSVVQRTDLLKNDTFIYRTEKERTEAFNKNTWSAVFSSDPLLDTRQSAELRLFNENVSRNFIETSQGIKQRIFGFFARKSTINGQESMYFAGIAYRVLAKCKKLQDCVSYEDVLFSARNEVDNRGFQPGIVILKRVGNTVTVLKEQWFAEGHFEENRAYSGNFLSSFEVTGTSAVRLSFTATSYTGKKYAITAVDSHGPLGPGLTGLYADGVPSIRTLGQQGGWGRDYATAGNYRVSVPSENLSKTSCPRFATNTLLPADANGDGIVTALDAQVITNSIARNEPSVSVAPLYMKCQQPLLYDVNADGKVTTLDSLKVMNTLARQRAR